MKVFKIIAIILFIHSIGIAATTAYLLGIAGDNVMGGLGIGVTLVTTASGALLLSYHRILNKRYMRNSSEILY